MATRYSEIDGKRRYIDTAAWWIDSSHVTPKFKELLLDFQTVQHGKDQVVGATGLSHIPKQIGATLVKNGAIIKTETKVDTIVYDECNKLYHLAIEGAESVSASVVVVTAPIPQSIQLLKAFPISRQLETHSAYRKCIVLLVWPKTSYSITKSDPNVVYNIVVQEHIQANANQANVFPLAIHATYKWSEYNYNQSEETIARLVLEACGNGADTTTTKIQVKKWLLSQPAGQHSGPGWIMNIDSSLAVCSDGLGIGKVNESGEAGISLAYEIHRSNGSMHTNAKV